MFKIDPDNTSISGYMLASKN